MVYWGLDPSKKLDFERLYFFPDSRIVTVNDDWNLFARLKGNFRNFVPYLSWSFTKTKNSSDLKHSLPQFSFRLWMFPHNLNNSRCRRALITVLETCSQPVLNLCFKTGNFRVFQGNGRRQVGWKDDSEWMRERSVRDCVINKLSEIESYFSDIRCPNQFLKVPAPSTNTFLPKYYLFFPLKF